MKVLFMATFALAFVLNTAAQVSAQTLLSEIGINPLGDNESCEYIEIRRILGADF